MNNPLLKAEFELNDAIMEAEEQMDIAEQLKDKPLEYRLAYFEGRRDKIMYELKKLEQNKILLEKALKQNEILHNEY